jgi:hypothetical protein
MTTDASAGLTRYTLDDRYSDLMEDGAAWVRANEADARENALLALLADLRGKLAEMEAGYNLRNDEVTGLMGMLERAWARVREKEAELAAATKDARRYAVLRNSVLSAPMSAGMTLLTTADDIDSQCDQIDAATKPAAPTVDEKGAT